MDDVARWAAAERAELFREAAARRGLAALLIEKDFWVCWTLKRIFSLTDRAILFKGGTSLSKAFGVIRRFSEDIDLSFDRREFGYRAERDPATPGLSGKTKKNLLKEMMGACSDYVSGAYLEALRAKLAAGGADSTWRLLPDDTDPDRATLLFEYPKVLSADDYGGGYVRPAVRIEFGVRSEHQGAVTATVTPYAVEEFAARFDDSGVPVLVQTAKRTFWEKATALHEKALRGFRGEVDRFSRHYSDVAAMAGSWVKAAAIADPELLRAVARHKEVFFPVGGTPYATARPGTLRLRPREEDLAAVRADYARMREMFFEEPPSFEAVMEALSALEAEINGAGCRPSEAHPNVS